MGEGPGEFKEETLSRNAEGHKEDAGGGASVTGEAHVDTRRTK